MLNFNDVINNSNYIKIASKMATKYNKLLTKEELEQCKCIGIWNACKNHDNKKSVLSTHISNHVRWECLKQITINKNFVCTDMVESTEYNSTLFQDLSFILNDEEFKLIKDRFLLNKTFKEIAEDNKISVDRIKNKISKILKRVKEVLS